MLKSITNVFTSWVATSGQTDIAGQREHDLQVATAILLIEMARADYSMDLSEQAVIDGLLAEHFSLSQIEVESLVQLAQSQADHAASLQAFTRQLVEELSLSEKHKIVEMLWRVAFADSELSKFEDGLVRKIANLLYVSHRDLIRIRNTVIDN